MGEYLVLTEMNRLSQRLLDTPSASVNPLQDGGWVGANLTRPFAHRLGDAAKRESGVAALIVGLLSRVSPPAVIRRVVPVDINPVNGVVGWAFSHVSKEAVKGAPSSAHGNAATTVVSPLVVLRVGATGFHVSPAVIRSGSITAVGMTMRQASRNSTLDVEATTGYGLAGFKTSGVYVLLRAAVANALKVCLYAPIFCSRNNKPSSKSLLGKVLKSAHDCLLKMMPNYSKLRLGT